MTRQTVIHPLGPVFNAGSRVLILGTMPSPASRAGAFYYFLSRNRFLTVLAALFNEPVPDSNESRRDLALRHGIALWDVLARCTIEGAGDASIRDPVANDIAGLLGQTGIRAIFTTGQTAGRLYRRLCQPQTGLAAAVLPSPSPANCAVSTSELIECYRAILPWLITR